ncbi:MAG: hypothetical protein P4K98_02000 [Bryobacteraceae bacterium]|nr:hypothetical protein [Bryobacteraceae bacterium]
MRSVQITLMLMPVLAFSLNSSQAQSDQFPADAPSEVTLTPATSGGESTFHIGQAIPLTLRFTSTMP